MRAANPRGGLEQHGRADASITDLAEKFHMTLTGIKKHAGVLEQAGLVATEKIGRVRTCRLGPRRLEQGHRLREYKWVWRDVRATGRASHHPGRGRGKVMKSSRWKTARHVGIEMP